MEARVSSYHPFEKQGKQPCIQGWEASSISMRHFLTEFLLEKIRKLFSWALVRGLFHGMTLSGMATQRLLPCFFNVMVHLKKANAIPTPSVPNPIMEFFISYWHFPKVGKTPRECPEKKNHPLVQRVGLV